MNRTLFVDATLQGVSLGLAEIRMGTPPRFVAIGAHFDNARSTAALHSMTNTLLQTAGWDLSSLTTVVAARGPGSFTGIKVGLAFAQALANGLNDSLKLVGVSGLMALAAAGPRDCLWLLPATRHEGYAAYCRQDSLPQTLLLDATQGSLRWRDAATRHPAGSLDWVRQWHMVAAWPVATAKVPSGIEVLEFSPADHTRDHDGSW